MSEQQPVQWQPLEPSEQDLEFMAHQEEVVRQICSVFAITPQELGVVSKTRAEIWEMHRKDFEAHLKYFIARKLREEQEA